MLRIMASDGTSQTIAPGTVGTGLVEAQTYRLYSLGGSRTILVDDIPLQPLGDGEYGWQPGFYAGMVRVDTCDASEQPLATYYLDVGPTECKLGAPLFEQMVEELLAYRPDLLLGTEAATRKMGHEGEHWNPEIGYARFRQHADSCVSALRAINRSPLLRLRHERRAVLPHQARRVDLTTIRELARGPAIAAILGKSDTQADPTAAINTPSTTESADNAANRAMAAIIDRLLARASSLRETFERVSMVSRDELSKKVPRRLEVIRQAMLSLKRIRKSPTFADITHPGITAEGLNAISAHPTYAMAFRLAWQILRTGIVGTAVDKIPISPTWQVFERWCFLQTFQLLKGLLPDAKWTNFRRKGAVDRVHVRGATGTLQIDVYLQARFRAWDVCSKDSFRSLSRERLPDIVVTLTSGSDRHLLILDAKYRSSRANVLDAMQSAHTYRDALLWGDVRPWRSMLLIPSGGAAPWLEDPACHVDFGVGCVEVRDSDGLDSLRRVLMDFVVLADQARHSASLEAYRP